MVWWSESILGEGGGRRALEFWASSATGSYNETRCICIEFGRAILCSDAATEAARYGFTESVDRPEGFLVLGVASQGDQITKIKTPPEDSHLKPQLCNITTTFFSSLVTFVAAALTLALPFLGFMKQKQEQQGHWNKNFIAYLTQ
ncbi:hypothetical protein ACFX13_031550 [Malus domestica]